MPDVENTQEKFYFPFQKFSEYFEKDYAVRAKKWCCAFRVGLRINTNMALESLHRIVKHDYMKGRVNKRLDKALYYFKNISKTKSTTI